MINKRQLLSSALSLGLGLTLWGCSTDTPSEQPNPGNIPGTLTGPVAPKFDPINTATQGLSAIPIPNDILRDPATGFNTRIPAGGDPQDSIRSLRGFSTTGNVVIPFDGQIDAATVNADTILFVEGGASTNTADAGTNNTIACNITVLNPTGSGSADPSTVILQPKYPLKPLTNYFVVITDSVQAGGRALGSPKTTVNGTALDTGRITRTRTPLVDANGSSLIFPADDATAQQLEPLRAAYQPFWERAESITGVTRESIPLVFRFGTQPLYAALAEPNIGIRKQNSDIILANPPDATAPVDPTTSVFVNDQLGNRPAAGLSSPQVIAATGLDPNDPGQAQQIFALSGVQTVDDFYANLAVENPKFSGAPHSNIRRIFSGTINMPNYINPTTQFFDGEGLPTPGSAPITRQANDLQVKFFLASPDAFPQAPPFAAAVAARPAVVFQHGFNSDKRDMFLVADDLCAQGKIVVGIDLYWHGDLVPVPGASSGQGFVNPNNMRATRDNFRQSISNLFFLNEIMIRGGTAIDAAALVPGPALPLVAIPFPPNGTPPGVTDPNRPPGYIGLSLGGIVGTPFTAVNPFGSRAVVSSGGGRLVDLFLTSPAYAPSFKAQLAAQGAPEGSDGYRQFAFIAQAVLDDIDPINYAAPALAGTFKAGTSAGLPTQQSSQILLQQMIGDATVPNSASSDLARSFAQVPLFRHVANVLAGIEGVQEVAAPFVGSGVSQFSGFSHVAILGAAGGDPSHLVLSQAVRFVHDGTILDTQP